MKKKIVNSFFNIISLILSVSFIILFIISQIYIFSPFFTTSSPISPNNIVLPFQSLKSSSQKMGVRKSHASKHDFIKDFNVKLFNNKAHNFNNMYNMLMFMNSPRHLYCSCIVTMWDQQWDQDRRMPSQIQLIFHQSRPRWPVGHLWISCDALYLCTHFNINQQKL